MTLPAFNIPNPVFHFREGIKKLCTIELFPAILQVSYFFIIVVLEVITSLIAGVIRVFVGREMETDFRRYHKGCCTRRKKKGLICQDMGLLFVLFNLLSYLLSEGILVHGIAD